MKAKIGIITGFFIEKESGVEKIYVNREYIDAITKADGTPIMIPVTDDTSVYDDYIDMCDGFVFSGGIDISPMIYGESPSRQCGATSLRLDNFQIALMKKVLDAKKPFIAICRGIQVLNVACGGTLYQDLSEIPGNAMKHMQQSDRGDISHEVSLLPNTILSSIYGEKVWTNSYHHQSLKDLGRGLILSAKAADGCIEAVEYADNPYGLGLQWHPEVMLVQTETMLPAFEGLVKASLEK